MYQEVKYSVSGGQIQCIRRSNASYKEVKYSVSGGQIQCIRR